jgi:hypothetical protein
MALNTCRQHNVPDLVWRIAKRTTLSEPNLSGLNTVKKQILLAEASKLITAMEKKQNNHHLNLIFSSNAIKRLKPPNSFSP